MKRILITLGLSLGILLGLKAQSFSSFQPYYPSSSTDPEIVLRVNGLPRIIYGSQVNKGRIDSIVTVLHTIQVPDTNSVIGLSVALSYKLNTRDTAAMLAGYQRSGGGSIAGKVNYTDTALMLNPYLIKANATVLYQPIGSYATTAALALKVNISDTSSMLNPYLVKANAAVIYASLSGSYNNPSWITGLAWSKISTTPTTLSGYGISDAYPLTGGMLGTGGAIGFPKLTNSPLSGSDRLFEFMDSAGFRSIRYSSNVNGGFIREFIPNITANRQITWPDKNGTLATTGDNVGQFVNNVGYLTANQTITFSPTGDVTATSSNTGTTSLTPVLAIGAGKVLNSMLAVMAAHTYKGNNTAGSTNPVDLTQAQLTAELNVFTSSLQGLVPASGGGTVNFLRADGTFAAPPSGFANPMTTRGDIIFENSTPTPARLAGPTSATKQFLTSTGTGSLPQDPAWGTIAVADVPTLNQSTTGSAGSISGTNVITNANIVQAAANSFKGNNTSGATTQIDMTVAQAKTLLAITEGDVASLSTDLGLKLTAVSVASANGFAGSSSGGVTPALTISTTISGLLKGNGTAISAAASGTDYAPPVTLAAGLTAAGSTQGTALALTGSNSIQEITTAAASTGVALPVATATSRVTVINRGANPITVYPATSGIINGQSANTGYTLGVNNTVTFIGKSATSWYTEQNFQGGDVATTDGSNSLVIGTNKVTNAQLAQMATNTIKGNNTGGTGNALDLTVANVVTMLSAVQTTRTINIGGKSFDLSADRTWSLGVSLAGIVANMSAVSAAINTTDTKLMNTASIAANQLIAGSTYRVTLYGTCTSTVANASNIRVRLGTAGTNADGIAAVLTPTSAASGTNVPFQCSFMIQCTATGSSGSTQGTGQLNNNGVTGISAAADVIAAPTTLTINTTVANIMSVWYVSAATTTTSTFQVGTIECVKL